MLFEWTKKKYGKLSLLDASVLFSSGSHKKVIWVCDCGKFCEKSICSVTSGNTTSCGQCNLLTIEHFQKKKYGQLRMVVPGIYHKSSHEYVRWICDCGRITLAKIENVTKGLVLSCGKCFLLTSDHFKNTKYGKLQLKNPIDLLPGSHEKVLWICDCGREKLIQISSVLSYHTTSCGQCNQISTADIATRKFGKLRIKELQDILPGSGKKIEWICDCGQEKLIRIYEVLSNHTTSCGQCGELVKNWYIQNREQIRSLKCPVDPKDFIPGGIIPLETIDKTGKSFKAICPACKGIYYPMFDNIKQGKSLTCGCASYRISMPVIQITEYIRSLGFEIQNEYKVNKLVYDILVPQKNLLIEFQGSKWHSSEKSKERDLKKKQNAIQNGYEFKEILEKDWNTKRDEIECEISSICNLM